MTLAATLAALNVLSVDRFVNPPRAMFNVIGNSLGAIVVAHWENAFDRSHAGGIVARR